MTRYDPTHTGPDRLTADEVIIGMRALVADLAPPSQASLEGMVRAVRTSDPSRRRDVARWMAYRLDLHEMAGHISQTERFRLVAGTVEASGLGYHGTAAGILREAEQQTWTAIAQAASAWPKGTPAAVVHAVLAAA